MFYAAFGTRGCKFVSYGIAWSKLRKNTGFGIQNYERSFHMELVNSMCFLFVLYLNNRVYSILRSLWFYHVENYWSILIQYMKRITRKRTLRSLSLSYQKKDERARPRPSFFWHDNEKNLQVCFLVTRII